MIPIGNKIEVIASSTKSKGAKIRKGSLGYISTISKPQFIGGMRMFSGNMLIAPAKIIFTRFGHEKKFRNEVKFVALVYPTIDFKTIKNKKTYLKRIVKQALDYTQEIKSIFKTEGIIINKVNAIAIHAVNATENVTNNKNECSAWLRSIAISGVLHKILFVGPNDPYRRTLDRLVANNTHNLDWLHACVRSKIGVEKYVSTLFEKDKEKLIPFVVRLHELLQLNSLQRLKEFRKFNQTFRTGGKMFGICWELYSMNLIKHIELLAANGGTAKNTVAQVGGWFNAYSEITKKSI